ncbi:GerMN domain-containing protein [Deinococcus maricopensis]|uniref:Lipoprotein LpqB, GerMN domain protein n=1 Tax=Deinococcus maricopensis (strain DSM 21211 / LMG 22137 / NRRL B-23946 / LB-34) TaxID=709986 RepID=E8U8U5_DEIML|nr:GerMN domain-containing protein [Deinococcus maricopensis]ADV67484.1 Lipoprotein LpqB, GerMN domain protein [Deinococcus maricopensis DSM 21211]
MRPLLSPFNVISALLLVSAAFVDHVVSQPPAAPKPPKLQLGSVEQVRARLYFTDDQVQAMRPEVRTVSATSNAPDAVARAALKAWVAGPTSGDALPVVPKGSDVPNVWVRGEHYFVNLPAAYARLNYGSDGERMIVCTLTRTLLESRGRDVTFLLNGRNVETLLGHVDLRSPFLRDDCED